MKRFIALIITLAVTGLVFTPSVYAQGSLDTAEQTIKDLGKQTGLIEEGKYIEAGETSDAAFIERFSRIINIVLGAVGVLAAVYLIYSAIGWMTAGGSEEKVTKAKQGISNAVIGIVIIFLGFIVVNFVVGSVIGAVQGS